MAARRGPLALIELDAEDAPAPEVVLKSLRSSLGHRFRIARQARRLSFDQLAAAVGVSHGMISKWERGMGWPKPEQLTRLKAALGITSRFLAMGDAEEQKRLEDELKAMTPALSPGCFLTPAEADARVRSQREIASEKAMQRAAKKLAAQQARERTKKRIALEREEMLAAKARIAAAAEAFRASQPQASPPPRIETCQFCGKAETAMFARMCRACWFDQ